MSPLEQLNKHSIRIFFVAPRRFDVKAYTRDVLNIVKFSDAQTRTGILFFTGHDVGVDPWSMAQFVLARTSRLSPLVAVNPAYAHPYTVAKQVSSVAALYGRKVYLNMVTGTSLSDLASIGEEFSHSERYSRLGEFIRIVKQLMASARPVTFNGTFYKISNLQLTHTVSQELKPEFLLAGQSEDARKVCEQENCLAVEMLLPTTFSDPHKARSLNFGILTRRESDLAWQAARRAFPVSEENEMLLESAMQRSDSVWKRQLFRTSVTPEASQFGYWLIPFANCQSDCPYIVGSYEEIAVTIRKLAEKGAKSFILDVLPNDEELEHVHNALTLSGIWN